MIGRCITTTECRIFGDYLEPGGGDERPVGLNFRRMNKPAGGVAVTFTISDAMPREMSLHAADLVHNARTALDHVIARLKETLGGSPGSGAFPVCATEDEWNDRMKRSRPLRGLPDSAKDFVHAMQPINFQPAPSDDPLLVLHCLDNEDKHELLRPSFVYSAESTGLDLISIAAPRRVRKAVNQWNVGDPLEDGTRIATVLVTGEASEVVGARNDAKLGFATGELGSMRTSYTSMVSRVRWIVKEAAEFVDQERQ